ncbi:uncharacterized protein LY79DRAFT_194290 [Colletotrichum navitas]|uniref:Uncharacterized protein n=1 Tax=Colletotrichum navitas TaxID=681940 RepID=A0AAD8PZK7_9PEZI|nr:uncharacterized protein LY79DRAFT_194290 [Colletotrichum navitas]KAK1590885.1 hypothetical protein LY79DRAFT_194290 [Colletotrichum navitas]
MCIFKVLRRHRLMPLAVLVFNHPSICGPVTGASLRMAAHRAHSLHLAVTAACHCFMASDKHLTSQPSLQAESILSRLALVRSARKESSYSAFGDARSRRLVNPVIRSVDGDGGKPQEAEMGFVCSSLAFLQSRPGILDHNNNL